MIECYKIIANLHVIKMAIQKDDIFMFLVSNVLDIYRAKSI